MSRIQSSLPSKSNALTTPVPVIAQTERPSVTGDGDDMFCFCSRWFPPPSERFHITAPRLRSMHQRNRLSPSRCFRSSATLRNTRSPQTMGVEPDQAGRSSVQVMFSVFDHRIGRSFSPVVPLSAGPRHCGQFSADIEALDAHTRNAPSNALSETLRSGIVILTVCLSTYSDRSAASKGVASDARVETADDSSP